MEEYAQIYIHTHPYIHTHIIYTHIQNRRQKKKSMHKTFISRSLKKEQPYKPQESIRRNKYIRAEMNETENVHTIEPINNLKFIFWKTNPI